MKTRRWIGTLLVAAGIALCAAAFLHYLRGTLAQREAKEQFEKLRSRAGAPIPTPGEIPMPQLSPSALENPGIEAPVPTPPPASYPYGQPLARLRIAAARIDVMVFGGVDSAILEKGPGHVPGTALPGGEDPANNCVITGHRDSHFRRLGWLKPGHTIELETTAGDKTYRIVRRQIVKPDAVSVLAPTASPRLTLITCYPFNYVGPAPQRLVLIAEPIGTRRARHSS